jgi:hypothetical protein
MSIIAGGPTNYYTADLRRKYACGGDWVVGQFSVGEVGFFGEPCAVAPDAKVNFNARYAEPSAVAPDARVNFSVVIVRGLAEETLLQAAPINFQPSLVRMLPLGKCLKLTLASGATAHGSAS